MPHSSSKNSPKDVKEWKSSQQYVRYAETDMYGWVHNSNFLRFVENAEHELFASIDKNLFSEETGWPRVNFTVDFRSPLTFKDPYQVNLTPQRLGNSSITWGFRVFSDERLIAEGKMTSVQLDSARKPLPICEKLREEIEALFG